MTARFLDAAAEIGYRLCRDALWAGDRCAWSGPSMEAPQGQWQVVERVVGPHLYDGTSGIALALAHLHAATREEAFRRAAEGAARQTLARLDALPAATRTGVYSGELGVVVALAEIGRALDEPRWARAAEPSLDRLLALGPDPAALDVVAGSAGAIPALLALAARLSDARLEELALRHGETILEEAHRTAEGWSWDTLPGASSRHLTGFAHGAAGMGWALLELHRATGDSRFREGAEGAFRYEEGAFDPAEENWPDFRESAWAGVPPGTPIFAVAWCHGAPGIGLTRLRAAQLLDPLRYGPQAEAALRTTRRTLGAYLGGAGDASLCHGVAGLTELLLVAHQLLPGSASREEAEAPWEELVARHHTTGDPWPCGVRGGGEVPGLMTGIAGIALHLLRLALPDPPPPPTFLGPASMVLAPEPAGTV